MLYRWKKKLGRDRKKLDREPQLISDEVKEWQGELDYEQQML